MIEHLETVHEEENKGWNKRNLAPTNSSDGKHFRVKPCCQARFKIFLKDAPRLILHFEYNDSLFLSCFNYVSCSCQWIITFLV